MFSINSTLSSNELVFSSLKNEYFQVELKGEVTGSIRVWAYTDIKELRGFFRALAKAKKPWEGKQSWVSIEEEFSISVTCSPLGKIVFKVSLWDSPGDPEEWKIQSGLVSEFGQLQRIGERAETFFNKNT